MGSLTNFWGYMAGGATVAAIYLAIVWSMRSDALDRAIADLNEPESGCGDGHTFLPGRARCADCDEPVCGCRHCKALL